MTVYDISQEAIEMATWRWAKPVQFYEVTDSTNDRAVAWARARAKSGSIVAADHQTEGRGRGDRAWSSHPDPAPLRFPVIHRPNLPPEPVTHRTMPMPTSGPR